MSELGIPGISGASLIASGGSALVYRAVDAGGNDVAVKVLRGMRGAEIARRFEREQTAAQRLKGHPNVLPMLGSGIAASGEPYLIMPLIERGSLHDELAGGPFPLERAVNDVIVTAEAIDHAHQRGVLHRDIKPGNLLRADDDSLLVADFGIARVTDAGITSATIGSTTPLYAAPELLADNEANVATEVYSLGALLYALLAGRPAFSDSENIWATMHRVQTEAPTPIAGAPDSIMTLVLRAMAKDPAERPVSAGLFAAYLRSALHDPTWTPPAPAPPTVSIPGPPDQTLDIPVDPGPPDPTIDIPIDPGLRTTADLDPSVSTPAQTGLEAPPAPAIGRPVRAVGDAPQREGRTVKILATVAALALMGGLGWLAANQLLGDDPPAAAQDGPVDTSLPSPTPIPGQGGAEPTPEIAPTPDTGQRFVRFSGDHFTALLPEGWSLLSGDVDVSYGFRSRFVAPDAYLNIDTTPDYAAESDIDIATSAQNVAATISSASPITTETIDGRTLHWFTFTNNEGVESVDIFFEADGDGYAVVAGSASDPATVFETARQVALSIRDAT